MKPTYKQVTKTRYIEQISQLAEEIFVQHYTKLTPKVARALAEKYQSDILTDDEIHSGTVNYFMIYLGSDPVGYFALDLTPTGAMCLSRLFLLEKARGQGIGRSIVAYAQKLAEGDGRSRLYLRVWAKDLKAEGFCKKCRFRKSETVPMEVLPGAHIASRLCRITVCTSIPARSRFPHRLSRLLHNGMHEHPLAAQVAYLQPILFISDGFRSLLRPRNPSLQSIIS